MQLLSIYLLLIVPFIIGLYFITKVTGQRVEQEVQATDLSLARAVAQETNITIRNALDAVEILSQYPAVIEADPEGMSEIFRIIMSGRPDIELIYRMDADGNILYYYPLGPTSTLGAEYAYRDYYKSARNQKVAFISEGRISPLSGQPVATAIMPIWSKDGKYQGQVGTNIKLRSLSETLERIIASQSPAEGFQVVILDSKAQIIAYPDSKLLLSHATQLLPYIYGPALSGDTGTVIARNRNNEERIYTYVTIPSGSWAAIVSRPTQMAYASKRTINYVALGTVFFFLLIGLFFWLTLTRNVIKPIEELANISQAIGEDPRLRRPPKRPQLDILARRSDQIGHLVRSILRMEQDILARINEQATLLETSTAVVSSLNLKTVLDRILEQVELLLGVSKSAIVALDQEQGVFRIRAGRDLSASYIEQITIQPNDPLSVTMRALRSKQPVQISDTESDLVFLPQRLLSREEGFRSILAVPLNTQHSPPAALILYRPDPHLWTENEISLVVNFANHAAMAIENAFLYERSDKRLQEETYRLEALVQSLHDGLILSDLQGKVLYANRRIRELSNLQPEEMRNTPVEQVLERIVVQSNDPENVRRSVNQMLAQTGKQTAEIPIIVEGIIKYYRLQGFEVTEADGASIGRGLILQDVTADRELDRMRSSLVSTVSHELRTPLAAIKGYATTLLAEDVEWDGASQRNFLEIISQEADRLSNLVNTLLDLSKIEAGSLRLSRVECEVEDLIQKATYNACLGKENQIEVQIDPNLPTLYADPPRLETVLRNLLENAIKYAGETAHICVQVKQVDQALEFSIADNGPGIPAEERERVFESFYRIENGLTRSGSGAGLGLAICQGLVRAHGGKIWIAPTTSGTRVVFTIPLIPKTAESEERQNEQPERSGR
ncbi:MAG: ATP-binding protein [Candidatus Villigracilaceae bacterium]